MFGGTLPLKVILVAVGTIATVFLTLFVAYSVRDLAAKQLTEQIGRSAAVLADQLEYKLDSDLEERSEHLEATSKLIAPLVGHEQTYISAMLNQARAYHDDLNWVGMFDLQGKQIAASENPSAGGSDESWPFVDRLLNAAKDINSASGPKAFLAPVRAGEPGSGHIELATPVLDINGLPVAVLVASFDWDWAEELGRSLGGRLPAQQDMQLIVVTDSGQVLVGPAGAGNNLQKAASFQDALKSTNGFRIEMWPSEQEYVTGYAKSIQQRFVDGHDWIVLVRQSAAFALEPVGEVQRRIITYAILFALLAIVLQALMATRIVNPLLQISRAADELRRSGSAEIPAVAQFAEVKILSSSLISLVEALKAREKSLENLSGSLERQVSERTEKLAEQNQALDVAKKVAEDATIAKTRFLAAASHDLRQPLQAMGLFANALNKRLVGTESAPIMKNLDQSIASLRNMLDALLHISRLDTGMIVGDLRHVSLREAVSGLAAEFQLEAAHLGLSFRCSVPDIHILTEPALFEVMVRNLVSNALKFTKRGGIFIGARVRGDKVAIEIYDTGPGISEEQKSVIFREFERAKSHATGPNDGLGLGLSIAERYARLTGADIEVRSRVGRGTRFSLIMPRASGPVKSDNITVLSQPKISGLHVMLLEDNVKDIESLSLFLRDLGAEVTSFETAESALSALRGGLTVDVAIVDYDLAGPMTGVDFLDAIDAARYEFEAIMLTGRTDPAAIAAMAARGRSWLSKPAAPETIATIIGRLSIKAKALHGERQSVAV